MHEVSSQGEFCGSAPDPVTSDLSTATGSVITGKNIELFSLQFISSE